MFSFLKKTILISTILGVSIPLSYAGNAVKFKVEIPETAHIGESVDITIKALDSNDSIDTSYSGSISFVTTSASDTIPESGRTIKIDSSKKGIYTFKNGMSLIGSEGSRTLFVYDIVGNTPKMGQATIQVTKSSNQNRVQATQFIIEMQDIVKPGEATDVTVKAVDADGKVDTNYTGKIMLTTNYIGDTIPMPGRTIKFELSDKGVKAFPKGIILKNVGTKREIDVVSIDRENLVGKKEIVLYKIPKKDYTQKTIPTNMHGSFDAWKFLHQTTEDRGFQWISPISDYLHGFSGSYLPGTIKITQPMRITESMKQTYIQQNTTYEMCVREKLTGKTFENRQSMKLLGTTAKICAIRAYGNYFKGKKYTTKEEVAMLLSMYFDTGKHIQGIFENGKFVPFHKDKKETRFTNVDSSMWYAPFIDNVYYGSEKNPKESWKIATEVTDFYIDMLYAIYHTDFSESGKITSTPKTQEKIEENWRVRVEKIK